MFNGFYTVTSPTGEHRTFQIRTQPEDVSFAPGKRIVSVLTGPDNEADYTGFGFVTEQGIQVWKTKRGNGEKSLFEKYADLLWDLAENGQASRYARSGMAVILEKRCFRCNRRLTSPISIETGIGPECATKM